MFNLIYRIRHHKKIDKIEVEEKKTDKIRDTDSESCAWYTAKTFSKTNKRVGFYLPWQSILDEITTTLESPASPRRINDCASEKAKREA